MPVESKAQWGKLASLVNQKKMSQREFQEWTHGVDYDKLPRHVPKRKKK